MTLVVCESVAAIVPHLRKLAPGEKPVYGGYAGKRALCGHEVAWDTKLPVPSGARCKSCLAALAILEGEQKL